MNDVLIYSITNTYGFTNGDIMIGHNDQFDSIGSADNYVIFDNVRVVSLDIAIKSITLLAGNQVQIDFVSPLAGLASDLSDFHLQSATDPAPANWFDDNSAAITPTANGFRAVTAQSGSARFYKIRR